MNHFESVSKQNKIKNLILFILFVIFAVLQLNDPWFEKEMDQKNHQQTLTYMSLARAILEPFIVSSNYTRSGFQLYWRS